MRALLIAALLVLGVASLARADRWPVVSVERAITVADNHWPDSPCHGRQRITWQTGAQIDAEFPFPATAGQLVTATADGPYDCDVWVAWDRVANIVVLCDVLMHEFGHNDGLDHSPDPSSPMYASVGRQPECVAAFKPSRWRWHHPWTW